MHPVLVLALLSLAPPQGSSEELTPLSSWEPVDGVALQAGDAILTASELRRFFAKGQSRMDISTQADFQREWSSAARASSMRLLEAQAGEDLGLDPTEIDRLVRWQLEDQEREVGTATFRETLEEAGIDPQSALSERREELDVYLWRSKVTGNTTSIGTRPIEDDGVRPGELLAIYHENKHALVEPDKVRLQICGILAVAAGGPEAGRALAEEVRRRALEGEDFGSLVLEFSDNPGDGRGLTAPIPVPAISDPWLRRFAETAPVGDVSGVRQAVDESGRIRFLVCRLHERVEGPPVPPFEDRVVQRILRRRYEENRERGLLESARQELLEEAFVWTNPAIVPPAPDPKADGSRNRPARR